MVGGDGTWWEIGDMVGRRYGGHGPNMVGDGGRLSGDGLEMDGTWMEIFGRWKGE